MSCSSSEALFEGYLDDTLVPAERARLLAHLNRCGRCKGVLEELRVVDALLATPRHVELPPNFTFATMAEINAVPRPHVSRAPVLAYLVSYLVAAWLLIAAALLFAGGTVRAFGETALDVSAGFVHALAAVAHAGTRVLGDVGALGTVVGGVVALDVVVACVLLGGFAVLRPRLAQRLRS